MGLTVFLMFGAAAAVGAGLGFLFGLPRARYAQPAGSEESIVGGHPVPKSAHYLTNSNLIKVSDWLTTIIVGIGLVNLAKIGPAAGELSNTFEEPLGGAAYAGIVGVSVIVIALIGAMILCYLWTSVRVRELLEESENRFIDVIPSLLGHTVRDAKTALGETTLKLDAGGAKDDAVITTQTPQAGSPALVGGSVLVTVRPTNSGIVDTSSG